MTKDMYNSEQLLGKVNQFIDELPYDRQPASLYEPIRYVLSLGGKRIRPVLMEHTHAGRRRGDLP